MPPMGNITCTSLRRVLITSYLFIMIQKQQFQNYLDYLTLTLLNGRFNSSSVVQSTVIWNEMNASIIKQIIESNFHRLDILFGSKLT